MKKEIVYTDKYALILSDEEIKEGDYRVNIQRNTIHFVDEEPSYFNKRNDVFKKVIAHLPLFDAPIIEGVPLLPSFSWGQQDDVKELAEEWNNKGEFTSAYSFKTGYNKAKKKYKYTEEDMLKAMKFAKTFSSSITDIHYIQSLQQPSRPTHFECEMEITHEGNGTYSTDLMDIGVSNLVPINILKTTTNSQGQEELVGKYLNL